MHKLTYIVLYMYILHVVYLLCIDDPSCLETKEGEPGLKLKSVEWELFLWKGFHEKCIWS